MVLKKDKIYFIVLFFILLGIYFPTFSNPPRSDYWTVFYFFHQLEGKCLGEKLLQIMSFDPWSHMRFQPLAYFLPYFQYLIFGSNFEFYHIFNFLLYCLSVLILYLLGLRISKDKFLVIAFVTLFAFLFTHFDIVSWTLHSYIIFGFILFSLAAKLTPDFLERSKSYFLLSIIILSALGAMFCYETFIFWPLGLLFFLQKVKKRKEPKQDFQKVKLVIISVIIIYIVYGAVFLILKWQDIHNGYFLGLCGDCLWGRFKTVIFITPFQLLYNNILANIFPILVTPLIVIEESGNIQLGGFVHFYEFRGNILPFTQVIFVQGICLFFLLGIAVYYLVKKRSRTKYLIYFFIYLLISYFFTLFYCRSLTNRYEFILTQFRYQYIPNAVTALLCIFLFTKFLVWDKNRKILLSIFLLTILIPNIYFTRNYIRFTHTQLTPLRTILAEIRDGIKRGMISPRNKVYIPDTIAQNLPEMCWNKEMGEKFIPRGSYQWMFGSKEIQCFSFAPEGAFWVINNDLQLVKKQNPGNKIK